MAVVTQSGNLKLQWRGATVLEAWEAQIQAGMEAEAAEVLADLRASLHVVSGRNRDSAFATVEVRGTKRTLRAGENMPYSIYEEYRHPVTRAVMDRHIPHVTERIRAARRAG